MFEFLMLTNPGSPVGLAQVQGMVPQVQGMDQQAEEVLAAADHPALRLRFPVALERNL